MQNNATALAVGKGTLASRRRGALAKAKASLLGGEIAGAQGTVEYVVVVGVAVAVGALIFAFKGVIGNAITKMTGDLKGLFGIS